MDLKLEQLLLKVDKSTAEGIRKYIIKKSILDFLSNFLCMTAGYTVGFLMWYYFVK